jgi:aspartyl-tRNA(Asn)/glutamyl-tRNA(Gln) amidotransferase subunit C
MQEKLTREEVLHVAELARISLTEEEIEKYQIELKELLNDVEKINEVKGYDDDILIACWSDFTKLRSDEKGEMLNPKEVIGSAPRHSGNYIEVPVVISDGEGA